MFHAFFLVILAAFTEESKHTLQITFCCVYLKNSFCWSCVSVLYELSALIYSLHVQNSSEGL